MPKPQVNPAPQLNAGDLDGRITLLEPVYATEFQDEISDWAPRLEVWAAVTPTIGMEVNEAGRTVSRVGVTVTIRYRPGIDARWRIQDGPHVYEIKSVVDVARRGIQLQLECEEVS